MTHIGHPELNEADREAHVRLAVEQSAMHAAHLAISRWSSGYCQCEAPLGQPQSPQSRWHAAAQSNFAVWLAAGGFAQMDAEPEAEAEADEPITASTVAAPAMAPESGWREIAMPRDSEGQRNWACTA
jgi:hypothetical protein